MPWEEDQCGTSRFPQFIVPESSSQDSRELKASLYDNHPWCYSHSDDEDLRTPPPVCVCVPVHVRVHGSPSQERCTMEVTVDPCSSRQRSIRRRLLSGAAVASVFQVAKM